MRRDRLGPESVVGVWLLEPPTVLLSRRTSSGVHLDTARGRRLSLRPRRPVRLRVGPPVDLSRSAGREPAAEVLHEATTAVVDALTAELEVLRGGRAPAHRYDPRRSRGERRTA